MHRPAAAPSCWKSRRGRPAGIYSAFLVAEEGTQSSFAGLLAVIAAKGLSCSLYTDRGGHYFHTPAAGGKVDKTRLTQVGRALAQLGIEHIPAYSPEARGRSERAFGTLQDRLVKELRLAGITTVQAANRFIAEVYLPDHNARFARAPEQPDSAFVPARRDQVEDILCRPRGAHRRQRQHRALPPARAAAARCTSPRAPDAGRRAARRRSPPVRTRVGPRRGSGDLLVDHAMKKARLPEPRT